MNKKKKKNIIKDYESEKDVQMIGCEPNSTPTYFHIMETVRNVLNEWGGYNRIPDISEIGEFVYSMDFDEDEYQEYLQDNELEDNDENKKTFIMDYVEFDFELLDSETYHSLGYYKLSYSDIENNFDEFGEPLACQVLNDCLKFGKGNIEKELLSSPSMNVDVNNPDSINMAAVKILPNGAYYKGCRGFILTNGVVVYTEAEHSHCMEIPGIKGTYDFVWKGNIRLIKDSINVWVKPTIEQKRTLLSVIRCYANEHLIISVCQNGEIKYKDFIHPNAEEIFNFLDRIYGVNESFTRIIREEIENTLQELNEDSRASITYNGKYYDFSDIPAIPFIIQNGKLIYGENEDTHEDAVVRYYLKMVGDDTQKYLGDLMTFDYAKLYARYTNMHKFIKNFLDVNFSLLGRVFMIDGKYIIAFDENISKDELVNVYYSLLLKNLIPNDPQNVYANFGGKSCVITQLLKV